MRQIEVSRTLVFDDPRRVRTVFEELLAGTISLGRPEHIEVIFGSRVTRKTPGVFSTRLLNHGDQVTINLSFRHSRIKIYPKEDRALRVETVINKSLRAWMTGLCGVPYAISQASYDRPGYAATG